MERALEDAQTGATESSRESLIGQMSQLLGIEIVRLIRYSGGDARPTYELEIAGGEKAVIMNIDGIISQTKFRRVVAESTGRLIPKCGARQWDIRAQALLDLAESRELPVESTATGGMAA